MSNQAVIVDTPENWDFASSNYAEKVAPKMMETFADAFIGYLDVNNQSNVLEVACGSGALTMSLAPKVGLLLSVDFAPKMIEIVQQRIAEAGMENVNTEVMDGMALSLPDNTFDRAICSFGLMLFPDRHKGFCELNRVVKDGGKVVVTAWAGPEKFGAFKLFLDAMNRAFPDMPKPDSPPPVFSLADTDSFKSQMEAAGFHDVHIEMETRELIVDGFGEIWGMMTSGAPPVKILFDKIGEAGKARLHGSLADIIKERYGSGPIRLSNTATVGVGTV